MKKRIFAAFLSLCLVVTLLPVSVFAAGNPQDIVGAINTYNENLRRNGGNGQLSASVSGSTVTITGTVTNAQKGGMLFLDGDAAGRINWNANLSGSCGSSYALVEVSGNPEFVVGSSGVIHNTNTSNKNGLYALCFATDYSAGVVSLDVKGKVISDAPNGAAIYFSNNAYVSSISITGTVSGANDGIATSSGIRLNSVSVSGSSGLLEGKTGVALSVENRNSVPSIYVNRGTIRGGNLGINLGLCAGGGITVTNLGAVEGGIATSASKYYQQDGGRGVEITIESGGVYADNGRSALSICLDGSTINLKQGSCVVSTSKAAVSVGMEGYNEEGSISLYAYSGSFMAGNPIVTTAPYVCWLRKNDGVSVLFNTPLKDTYEKNSNTDIKAVNPETATAVWTDSSYNSNGFIKWSNSADGTSGSALIPGVKVVEGSIPDPTYTITLDPKGGTLTGGTSLTTDTNGKLKQPLPTPTRTGYKFVGWFDESGKQVSNSSIFTKNTTLTARWEESTQIDVSDKITFTAKQTETTYTGSELALSEFVNPASCSVGSSPITYVLAKDQEAAKSVTLNEKIKDAGTYTITATYEDTDHIGTKSLTFTIRKATPVLTVTRQADPLTVIVNTEETVPASAKLGETVLPLTVTSSNENTAVVTYSQGNVTVKGIAAGEATITVSYPGDSNINAASKSFQVKVIDLPAQEITFAESGDRTATYGDPAFTNAATNHSQQGGAISYSSSNPQVAAVDANGQVTILAAGETTITATAAMVEGSWAETSVSYKLTVAKKPLTVQATASEKTYDGTTDADVTVTFQGLVGQDTLAPGADYTFTASYADANAGTDKAITGTVTLKNTAKTANYVLADGTFSLADGVITQAPGKDITQTINVRFDDTSLKTASAANVLPADAGNLAYVLDQLVDDGNILAAGTAVDGASGALTFALKEGLDWETAVGKTAQAPILITSTNFADSTATMKVNVVYEYVPVVDVENITVTYSGQALSQDAIHGTATYNGVEVPGTWSFQADSAPISAGTQPVVVIFTPDDLDTYAPVETTILVTIQKADPTGKPGYTPITQEGKTLADAALNIGTLLPAEGTLTWDDGDATIVTVNTAYGWTFVPDDTDNYNVLTGTITPYARSSGGGGGGSSVNITVKTDGHGKITVSPRSASKGDTVTITVKPNEGYELDELIVTDRNGDAIKLSQKDDNQYTFTMPSIRATVEATFRKVEESSGMDFTDVPASAYYYDAVKWAVENGITSGTSATTFSPDAGCTRGQVVTFLWQAFGRPQPKSSQNPFTDISPDDYYYEAVLWAYEQGITSGATATTFAPNATCTRAQIVTFLWQAEDRPGAKTDSSFYDVAADAYYAQAVAWAVANDITSGTSAYTFSPDATCTRAQVVTFLYHDMVD